MNKIYVGLTIWHENDREIPLSVWSVCGDRQAAKEETRNKLIRVEAIQTIDDDSEEEGFRFPTPDELNFDDDSSLLENDVVTVVEEWTINPGYVVVSAEHLEKLYELWYRSHDVTLLADRKQDRSPSRIDAYHEAHFEASRTHSPETKAFANSIYDRLSGLK